jgi:hypothetical protein
LRIAGKDCREDLAKEERGMTEYHLHWRPSKSQGAVSPSVKLEAESQLHGAALALRHFKQAGIDINAPLAHVDMTESGGGTHAVLVEEVLDWLNAPEQTGFVNREGLSGLLG